MTANDKGYLRKALHSIKDMAGETPKGAGPAVMEEALDEIHVLASKALLQDAGMRMFNKGGNPNWIGKKGGSRRAEG